MAIHCRGYIANSAKGLKPLVVAIKAGFLTSKTTSLKESLKIEIMKIGLSKSNFQNVSNWESSCALS